MESFPTQLAIPGQYAPLHRNMIAPSLRAQIQNNNKILHTHNNILPITAFREDEYTSKIGGLPSWLPPSPSEHEVQDSNQANQKQKLRPKFTQPIPTCPGCHGAMMLISQMFSPIDFITDLEGFDATKPVVSCFTSAVIKKFAAAINLNSSAPDTIINVSRHARTLYVFACAQGLCALNPGAWKTVAMVQSIPKDIFFNPVGHVVNKKQQKQMQLNAQKNEEMDHLSDDNDDDYDDFDDEDEFEDDLDDIDAMDIASSSFDQDDLKELKDLEKMSTLSVEALEDCKALQAAIEAKGAAKPKGLPVLDVIPQPKPSNLINTKKAKNGHSDVFAMAGWSSSDDEPVAPKKNISKFSTLSLPDVARKQPAAKSQAKPQGMFAMAGFSDSDDASDPKARNAAEQKTSEFEKTSKFEKTSEFEQLKQLVAETQALQLKTIGKTEKQIREQAEKQKKQKRIQRMVEKGQNRVPVIVEPKTVHLDAKLLSPQLYEPQNNLNSEVNDTTKLIVYDDVVFFRPFYLWWQGEEKSGKIDYSKEQQLLQDYFSQKHSDGDDEGDGDRNASDQATGKEGNDGNTNDEEEDEDDEREDPYDIYQEAINNQPEQVIRYFNSHLSLHPQPKHDSVEQFKKSSKHHALQKYTTQSGVWLLHDIPKCNSCGSALTLECQILPTLLSELKPDEFEMLYHRNRLSIDKKQSPGPTKNHDDLTADDCEKLSRLERREARIVEKKYDFDWGLVNVYHCLNVCAPDEYTSGFCLIQPGM